MVHEILRLVKKDNNKLIDFTKVLRIGKTFVKTRPRANSILLSNINTLLQGTCGKRTVFK